MANNQRRTAPGAVNKPAPFNKTPLSNQPRVARVPPRPPQPPIPMRPPVQMKQVPTARGHNHGAGPHINQHSAHLQRTVQMKLNQSRGANRVIAPPHARTSGVVQPSCIVDFFREAWRTVSSCWNSSAEHQPLVERGTELSTTSTPRVVEVRPTLRMVDQEVKIKNVAYPASVNAVYVAGCALVIFCGVDSFDCYHPSGGTYKGGHGLRNNPTRIYYVYRSLPTDSDSFIQDYHASARRYQIDGGGAPLRVLGQRGVKANIWVDVMSQNEIGPNMGSFI